MYLSIYSSTGLIPHGDGFLSLETQHSAQYLLVFFWRICSQCGFFHSAVVLFEKEPKITPANNPKKQEQESRWEMKGRTAVASALYFTIT